MPERDHRIYQAKEGPRMSKPMGAFKSILAVLITASATFVAGAVAQTPDPPAGQRPEPADKIVQGQVKSIDREGTEITLTDGTRLLTPRGATIEPGAVTEGMTVIASYREENGDKIMTELAVEETSASPPAGPGRPAEPAPAPSQNAPKRY
jgi:hypothetical protein